MDSYILGIDLGTTTVKASIYNEKTDEIVEHYTKATNSDVSSDIEDGHEQNVLTIISALNICVSKLDPTLRSKISKIGVCGQMHGVLFWNISKGQLPWVFHGKTYRVNENQVSRLYTWQDGRCDPGFLAELPKPDSHLGISTGFGLATIFWLKRNTPEFLTQYNRCGLISSFVVAMLANQEVVYTSYQNAASWGYFNCKDFTWNTKLLEKNDIPVDMLPRLKAGGEIAGSLAYNWHEIPCGVPIGVDLGDLQCSVLSTICSEKDAIINFSTSAQIAFISNNYVPPKGPPLVNPVSYWPFFGHQYVAVAASLNGGNVLVFFVEMIKNWLESLNKNVNEDQLWNKLIELGLSDNTKSNLIIRPTCLGERFDPNLTASVLNISGTNLSVGHVFKTLCVGLVENLHSMLPSQLLQEANIKRIVGNGQGLVKNEILQKEFERVYKLPLVFDRMGDASRGAAMAMRAKEPTDFSVPSCYACDHKK